jgi:hypothetical protein
MAVMLAKALVELDIAVPGDWKRAECDPTSFTRLTLGIRLHTAPPEHEQRQAGKEVV